MARSSALVCEVLCLVIVMQMIAALPIILEGQNRFLKQQRRLQSKMEYLRSLNRIRPNHTKFDDDRKQAILAFLEPTPHRRLNFGERERVKRAIIDENPDHSESNYENENSDNHHPGGDRRWVEHQDPSKNRLVAYKRYKNCFLSPVQCVVRFWASNNSQNVRFHK